MRNWIGSTPQHTPHWHLTGFVILCARLRGTDPNVTSPSLSFIPHRMQRRLSVALSMLVCLWMLATATHFHTPLDDLGAHHGAKELCGFCASVPTGGAAPSVWTFTPISHRQHFSAPSEILPAFCSLLTASYRSRAPPTV